MWDRPRRVIQAEAPSVRSAFRFGSAPLIGGIVADTFGTRYLAILLGISLVVHDLASSLGGVRPGVFQSSLSRRD
jgi:hypothetical protein